jgi:hypothetical protein
MKCNDNVHEFPVSITRDVMTGRPKCKLKEVSVGS